ncbi:MAG TPA: hypothetical protein VFA52_02025 [Candidatus Paceibacterota bacterium]|nr:hypothetical protein [Candidatus Paceibacterota bacterium]
MKKKFVVSMIFGSILAAQASVQPDAQASNISKPTPLRPYIPHKISPAIPTPKTPTQVSRSVAQQVTKPGFPKVLFIEGTRRQIATAFQKVDVICFRARLTWYNWFETRWSKVKKCLVAAGDGLTRKRKTAAGDRLTVISKENPVGHCAAPYWVPLGSAVFKVMDDGTLLPFIVTDRQKSDVSRNGLWKFDFCERPHSGADTGRVIVSKYKGPLPYSHLFVSEKKAVAYEALRLAQGKSSWFFSKSGAPLLAKN